MLSKPSLEMLHLTAIWLLVRGHHRNLRRLRDHHQDSFLTHLLSPFTLIVSVPENVNPGQEILVTAPDGSGQCMRATVPEGALPGHTFLVKMETPPVMTAIPVEKQPHDLLLTPDFQPQPDLLNCDRFHAPQQPSQIQPQLQIPPPQTQPQVEQQQSRSDSNDNQVLVHVPPGVAPGSKIRVKIPDGRVIEATVPQGEVTQFYVKVPPKNQNWHDNPAAYAAPMVIAPFLL